jgi:VCBS repeat-containing protein
MASDNNPGSTTDPIGSPNDAAQQDWLELDQQGVAGETLKAKKWSTKRRLVDDSSHYGNIHTGTEQVEEFEKRDGLSGEATEYQALQSEQARDTTDREQQQVQSTEDAVRSTERQTDEDIHSPLSSEGDRLGESESVVAQGGGADPLVFDERFDESPTGQNQSTRDENVEGQSVEAPVAPQSLTTETTATTATAPELTELSTPPIPDETSVQSTTPVTTPEEETEPTPVVDSTASAPILDAKDASGLEDSSIALDLSSQLTDTDGSESLTVTISGVPSGALLSAGNNQGDGTWLLTPEQLDGLNVTPPTDSSDTFSLTVTATSTEQNGGQQQSVSEIIDVFVEAVNDAPIITSSEQINITEDSMEGFTGYGETWEGDVYSVVTQAEMLEHLGITDVDSDTFTVSLANASPAWHDGLQSNDSTFTSDTLASGSSQYDETVIQVTQEFLDNYPSVDAQVGDFYFDHVDFDALSEGEIANVSFSVQVSDGQANSAPQEMNIQITGSNDAPTISGTVTLPQGTEDNAVSFSSADLLANAHDVDSQDTLFVTNLSVDADQGSISTNPDGSFTFTPQENFNGDVSISYDVTDGIEIVPTSASLTLSAVNDNPIAVDDSASTNTQAQLDGNNSSLITDSSVIHDNSTPYTISIDVTPEPQDYGYIISNGGQTGAASGFFVTRGVYGKDSSIYQIGVADENQSVVFQGGEAQDGQQSNLTFTYDGDALTVYQDGVDITDTGTITTRAGRDLPMQNLSLGAPSNVLTSYEFKGETDNIQIYDSALDASEVGQIQEGIIPDPGGLLAHYTFEGESGLEDQSGFGHTLQANGDVQFAETSDPAFSTSEDAPLTITAETLLANDSDVDGDTLSITAVSEDVLDSDGNIVGSAAQDADGNIVFTPGDALDSMAEGDTQDVNFSYTVSDGQGGTDNATVSITVSGENDAISVVSDSDGSANIIMENADNGTEIHVTGLATDADGDAVSYSLVDALGNAVDNGAFAIDEQSGVVTLQDNSQIDHETADSHTLHIQASSADGTTSTSEFTVQIGDVEVIKTTDLGGDEAGTAVTFTLTGDHYDPQNIQDVGAGSPKYHIRVNGELLEVAGEDTFSVEANRGHVEDNHVVRDGNDVELVTFRVPEGTDVDSVSIEFINDAWDSGNDNDGDGITTEDRNLVVKELNIGGTVSADGSIDGGVTLQAEDTDVSQYIASNGRDVSGREAMPWQGTMTFYPDGVNEAPVAVDDAALSVQFDIPEGGSIVSTDSTATVVTGEIVAEGDTGSSIDQWTFHHNGGPVTIDTLSESGADFADIDGDGVKDHIDTMMRLYDSDGNQVAMNDDSREGTTDGSTNDTYSHIQDSFIQMDDLPPGNYSLAIGSWELTSEEVTADHNDNYDSGLNYDHAQDTGPYQISITGDHSFTQPDPLTTDEDSSLTITAETLLANDSDADGDSLSITAVSEDVLDSDGNVMGSATQDGDGNIVFTPGDALDSLVDGENQEVSFNYTVSDGQGGTDTATTTINVEGTDNDLTYVSETAGYKNVVGLYQVDEDGNPIAGTVVIDDQNGMAGGTHLADLEPGSHEFFIIANGAGEIEMDSAITFDTSGDKPVLLIDGQEAAHPVYFTEPAFNPDGKDHFQFRSDGEGGTFVNIEDLPNLGDADFGDVVLHTNFEMSDKTLTGTAVDGIIEGLEYTTTSGINGFTDSKGDFSYNSGDSVTFNVGGVTLGIATPEDLSTGTTFLQDIADVDRTNLNDEYLENMATFLQSLDENSDAYDGIVITDEIREQLADADIDLTTASEEDVQQLVESIGKEYVSEDAAMDHVEDMLVDRTDLEHAEFEEHIDDTADTTQREDGGLTASAAEGFEAADSASAMEETRVDDVTDISLSVPSLDLPGTENIALSSTEEIATEQSPQNTDSQENVSIPQSEPETVLDETSALSNDADLAQSLPESSLSSLFEEPGTESEDPQADTTTEPQQPTQNGEIAPEPTILAEDTDTETPVTAAEDLVSSDEATSTDEASTTTEAHELSTDGLHIAPDDHDSTNSETSTASEESNTDLDSFAATSEAVPEESSSSSLDSFSANYSMDDSAEVASVEEINASQEGNDDQVEDTVVSDDAGLNDVDAIQEDLSEEPEPVDTNGMG